MPARTHGYACRIDVLAPRELVWRSLIEPALLALWYGPEARIAPRAEGSYWIRVDAELTREAHIDVFDPGRRLRLIYMPRTDLPPTDSVIVDDFLLDSDAPSASLRVLGSGYPDDAAWQALYRRVRQGWPQAFARLKIALERLAAASAS